MSDTVKLIIEISKSAYEEMSKYGTDRVDYDIQQMIKNSIPFDDIKAEIEKAKRYKGENSNPVFNKHDIGLDRYFDKGLDKALKILNNIGKESEGG